MLTPFDDENTVGNASRNITASNNLIFTEIFSFSDAAGIERRSSYGGLYQEIAQTLVKSFTTERALTQLINRLVSAADQAHSVRRLDVVGSIGGLLKGLPANRRLESIGDYYLALSINRGGVGDTVRAAKLFEKASDSPSLNYRARALLAIGSNYFVQGKHKEALWAYSEVLRISSNNPVSDPVTLSRTMRSMAVIRGIDGDHQGAVSDLQRIFPLVRMASSVLPFVYYDYMNALAVELGELGRLEEARLASTAALKFPFVNAFPEWQETRADLDARQPQASNSSVTVRKNVEGQENLLHFSPARKSTRSGVQDPRPGGTPARVLNFQHWKTGAKLSADSLPKESVSADKGRLTTAQKLIRLMDLISRDETDDETIDKILESVELIVSNRRNARLD